MTASESAAAREKVVAYSKQYVGSPYVEGGIGPDSFDCSGFVFTSVRESIGVQLPRVTTAMYSFVTIIPDSQREPGDLVFFKTTDKNEVSHVGIYMGNEQFIHCASDGPNTGVIVSSLKENYWKSKYFCSGQFLPPTGTIAAEKTAPVAAANPVSRTSYSEKRTTVSPAASLIADAGLSVDWNFFNANYFKLMFRGVDASFNVRYAKPVLQPGGGIFLRYDSGTGVFQIPIVATLSLSDYFRIYAGPVISIGTPFLPGETNRTIQASFFPGILGVCWQTPPLNTGTVQISLAQDIHYNVYNKTDGSALSLSDSIASGLVFSTGIRVTLPFSKLIH